MRRPPPRPVFPTVLDAVRAIPVTPRTPLVVYLVGYLAFANLRG